MYAIIRTGGKQYKVKAGDTLRVEKLEKELGSEFDVDEVLVVGGEKTFVGESLVQGAKVTVVVTRQEKAPKVIVFKKKRRQGYRRMKGHRQLYTELFVKSITNPEGEVVEADKEAKVFSFEKKAVKLKSKRLKKSYKAKKKEDRQQGKSAGTKSAQKKAVKKKKTTRKAAAKKTVTKKAATKKTATKKTAAKKATKKKT